MDAVKNFAFGIVSTGYDSSATSIVLTTDHGQFFPVPATDGLYNCVWWNTTDYTDPAAQHRAYILGTETEDAEIIRIGARTTDTLSSITRAQEGTTATNHNKSGKVYSIILAVTAKTMTDIDTNKANLASPSFTGDVAFDTNTLFVDAANHRVGIGTASPGTTLEVLKANQNLAETTNVITEVHIAAMTNDSAAIDTGGAIGMGGYYLGTSARQLFGIVAGRKENVTSGDARGYLSFWTNNYTSPTEKMRIDSTGNVGIGTTSPGYKLDVQGGQLNIQDTNTGHAASLLLHSDTQTYQLGVIGSAISGRANNFEIYDITNSQPRLSISSNGNVGIGTTSPGVKLQIGNLDAQNTLKITGINTANMAPILSLFRIGARESVIAQGVGGNAPLYFANTAGLANYQDATIAAAANMVIDNSGYVGIGYTSDPTSGNKFAVNGNSYFNGTGTYTGLLSSTGLNSVSSSTSGDGTIHPHVFLNNTSTATRSVSTYVNNADDNAVSAYWTTDGLGTEIYGYAGSFIGTYSNHPFTIVTNHAEVVKFGIDKSTTFAGSVTTTQFRLSALNTAPANASDTGTLGEIRIVDGYIYVCVATNTWQRAAIATW